MRSPYKRPREQSATAHTVAQVEVQRIVRDLNQAVTSKSRLKVLSDLFHLVGYDNKESRACSHPQYLDHFVKYGAINALCLQLGFVLNKRDPCLEDLVCRAIGVLYHCSGAVRETSLREIGADLFALLQKAVDHGSANVAREVMAVWHTCTESHFGSTLLLRQPSLLRLLTDALQDKGDSGDIQAEALGILKHITHFTEDHRLRILEEPGLMCLLTRIPFQSRPNKVIQQRLSAIFRNLALSPNTRLAMANQNTIISALIRLTNDFNRRTSRNVMSTFNSLILEAECCLTLLLHGDGILLNVLSRLISCDHEDDEVVRRRAGRVLRFMARESCLPLMIAHEELMASLSSCARSDPSDEVRLEAAEAFAKCATVIHAPMPQHKVVLTSFTHLARRHPSTLPDELVARVLNEQASRPVNRGPMASHDGLLDALSTVATSESASVKAKKDAISALHFLSCEKSNQEAMATSAVLTALVENAAPDDHAGDADALCLRDGSVKTLLNLAAVPSNRKAIVTQDGLLKMLVHYAASTRDASVKSAIKQAILWLVPLL